MSKRINKFLRSQMEESLIIRNEEREIMFSKYWFIAKTLKWFFALAIGVFALLFWGCGAKTVTVTEYQRVEVPVKCKIEIPAKPTADGDIIELNYKILKYAKELEAVLKLCK